MEAEVGEGRRKNDRRRVKCKRREEGVVSINDVSEIRRKNGKRRVKCKRREE